MKKEKLPEVRVKGAEIAEILAYLKSLGFCFEGEDKGFLKCLLIMNKEPTHKVT